MVDENQNFWKWIRRGVILQDFPEDEKVKEDFYQKFMDIWWLRKNKTKILNYTYKRSYVACIREFLEKWYVFEDSQTGKEVSLCRGIEKSGWFESFKHSARE